jgi:hypothetical protein
VNETPDTGKPASLPQDILDLLVEFARAAQRFGMYPSGHPARETTARQVTDQLLVLVSARGSLRLEIRRDRFTVSGIETDPGNNLLAAFAGRLYEHQLICIAFDQGMVETEIAELLTAVSTRVGPTVEPLGAGPPEQLNRWANIKLEPVPYDSLSLSRGRAESGSTGSVDQKIVPKEAVIDAGENASAVDLDALAAAEQEANKTSPFDAALEKQKGKEVGEKLSGIAAELAREAGKNPEATRQLVSRLILNLDPGTLQRLTDSLPDEMRSEGIEDAISIAVSHFLKSATSGTGDEHSASMLKLLIKLGMRGEVPSGPDEQIDEDSLSELVERLSKHWQLDDPSPEEYKEQLDRFSREAPILAATPIWLEEPRTERVLQMSLEMDKSGPLVEQAVLSMIENGELRKVLDLFESVSSESESVKNLWPIVTRLDTVKLLLECDPPDFANLDKLIPRLDGSSADPMLDTLIKTDSRTTRKGLIERLLKMGSKIGTAVVERLENESGDIRRIMLVILKFLPSLPDGFSPEPYLADPERGVRLEAMKLALKKSSKPEEIIGRAIRDSDQQIVELGLAAAGQNCPPSVIPDIISIVRNTNVAPTLRMSGIRVLSSTDEEEALEVLLELTWVRRWIILKKLASKSSEMLEALAVLARSWNNDARAQRVLEAAVKDKDAQIRAIARSREGSE